MRSLNNKLLSAITGIKDGRRTGYLASGRCCYFKFKYLFLISHKIVFW